MGNLESVRSVLFLPASKPRAIGHARESAADLVVLDLEDAVKPGDKDSARVAAVEAASAEWPMPVAIRINGVGTDWHSVDVDDAPWVFSASRRSSAPLLPCIGRKRTAQTHAVDMDDARSRVFSASRRSSAPLLQCIGRKRTLKLMRLTWTTPVHGRFPLPGGLRPPL